MNYLDNLYLDTKFKMKKFFSDFKNEEEGVSNIVATVILILIVVLLAAALWGILSGFFNDLWDQIRGKANLDPNAVQNTY
ncbi:MAG: hypothetical protein IKP92_09655 [Lachnospiraceae bacterium]|nr:hypothetical protein [Lachnospiraceae bacterium]